MKVTACDDVIGKCNQCVKHSAMLQKNKKKELLAA
jgi:hypothetical protein